MYYNDILKCIGAVLERGEANYSIDPIVHTIQKADRIFLAGAGRSGLVAKLFAMRLVHLGKKPVYIVGDVTTPAITEGDTLIIISGSGRTKSLINYAMTAQSACNNIVVFTSDTHSPLADMAMESHGGVYHLQVGIAPSITPLGTLFELSVLILLEAVIRRYMDVCGISEEEMKQRHANLE